MLRSREKPYTTNQETWCTILQRLLQIPMNQREYSWTDKEIKRFLDDITHIFEEGKYVEKMGSIINLKYKNENFIYDGQQRILTIMVILLCISLCEPKLKQKVKDLLTIDIELDTLISHQQKIKDDYNVKILPKLYCINPNDMKALVDIFNDKIDLSINYMENTHLSKDNYDELDEDNDDEEENNCNGYICNKCHVKIEREQDFIRHLVKKHEFKLPSGTSKLYTAYKYVYNYLIKKKYDESTKIQLYKFILNDIDVQFYDCYDPVYVSRIFDWENNRGANVEVLDLIKNPILVQVADDKKIEVYNKWENLKHKENKIYKNFGQKIFDVAIQLFNNEIKRTINVEELYSSIIESDNTYIELGKFFDIVTKLFEIMDNITEDKFGRLLNNTSRVCINWEAYMWCLLPVCYIKGTIDNKLIKLFSKWYFRQIGTSTTLRGFNNLCYSNEFIRIINCYLKDNSFDYYGEIERCLQKNKDKQISYDNYENNLSELTFKSTNATHLLFFLETCENTDIHTVPLTLTLEHIVPQKNKDKLKKIQLINNIGNLTLLEGKNSENGHKGNSSAGCKDYDKKIKSYSESSCKITRNIAINYSDFNESQIEIRCSEISKLLNKYTNY